LILQGCLDAVQAEVQQAAARYNNRGFLYKCLDQLLGYDLSNQSPPSAPAESEDSLSRAFIKDFLFHDEEELFTQNNLNAHLYM